MISINQLSKQDINTIIGNAMEIKTTKKFPNLNRNGVKIIGLMFLEPSTRTMHSFESAIHRSNGRVIKYETEKSSEKKGESLYDTVKTMSKYVDLFIVRHPLLSYEKPLMFSEKYTEGKPVINAGNSIYEHPTQALLDIFTIFQNVEPNNANPIKIGMVGDLKHSRTIHSLIYLITKLKIKVQYFFICNKLLELDDNDLEFINKNNLPHSTHDNLEEVISELDILYMTRTQTEKHCKECNISAPPIILNKEKLNNAKESLVILHPLPRNEELCEDVDDDPRAKYFEQVENGIYIRAALMDFILNPENMD